jgi:lysozyme
VSSIEEDLQRDEGIRLTPYTDSVGKLTIGIGRNLDDNGITHSEALMMMANDIISVQGDMDRAIPWWAELSARRQDALTNMAFNLGLPRLLKFKKMLAALEAGRWTEAKVEALDSKWARQVGDRAIRIAEIFRTGG